MCWNTTQHKTGEIQNQREKKRCIRERILKEDMKNDVVKEEKYAKKSNKVRIECTILEHWWLGVDEE